MRVGDIKTRPFRWSICGMCYAAGVVVDLESELDKVCRNCGREGTLCACDECQDAIRLLTNGVDIEQDLSDGSSRQRIHAKGWTLFFGARKVTKVRRG